MSLRPMDFVPSAGVMSAAPRGSAKPLASVSQYIASRRVVGASFQRNLRHPNHRRSPGECTLFVGVAFGGLPVTSASFLRAFGAAAQ